MLVVLSDLHFQEDPYLKDRNLEPRTFRILFEQLARVARAKDVEELMVVFNGDLFDHMRNRRWYVPAADGTMLRPYMECDPAEGQNLYEEVEERAFEIHKSIEEDERVRPSIQLIQAMARQEDDIFEGGVRPRFMYVPGTCDRLANLSPSINRRMRELFALDSREESSSDQQRSVRPFPNQLLFSAGLPEGYPRGEDLLNLPTGSLDYALLVQHGHEYDWLSCEYNYDENLLGRIPVPEDSKLYRLSPLSDWITIDLIGALAERFLQECGAEPDELIEENKFIYGCLLEAEDIRPQLRALQWLMWRLDGDPWKRVRHLVRDLLVELRHHGRLKRWLHRHNRSWMPDRADQIKAGLAALSRLGDLVPDSIWARLAQRISARGDLDVGPQELIRRDPIWQWDDIHYLCYGHFHDPSILTLGVRDGCPKMAAGTGTWRRRHQLCLDQISHVALRSLNYAIFYRPEETAENNAHRAEIWTGQTLTQRSEIS